MNMNKRQIRAELRRSARMDKYPAGDLTEDAFDAMLTCKNGRTQHVYGTDDMAVRTFYLLCAEAL